MGARRENFSSGTRWDYVSLRGAENPESPERPSIINFSIMILRAQLSPREFTAGGALKRSTRRLRGRGPHSCCALPATTGNHANVQSLEFQK